MPPDLEKYRKHVERFDLSEEQKVELIHTVWTIMESFVDRAFGIDPVQQSRPKGVDQDSNVAAKGVQSHFQPLTRTFDRSAGNAGEGED